MELENVLSEITQPRPTQKEKCCVLSFIPNSKSSDMIIKRPWEQRGKQQNTSNRKRETEEMDGGREMERKGEGKVNTKILGKTM